MSAYLYNLPSGFSGQVTRVEHSIIEPVHVSATATPALYGVPVKFASDGIQSIEAGDVDADVYGVVVRPFVSSDTLDTKRVADILKVGYMNVLVYGASPSKGSPVYVRVTAGAGGEPVGSFSTVSDSSKTFALSNAKFVGGKDSNGIAEIFVNRV